EHHRLVVQAVAFGVPQRVLHPVVVVAVGEVIVGVRATAFRTGGGRHHRGLSGLDQVVNFQRLDAGGVEDLGVVLQADGLDALAHRGDALHAFVHGLLGAEHAGALLHGRADLAGHVLGVFAILGRIQAGQARQRVVGGVLGQRLVVLGLEVGLDDVVAGGAAKHDQVEQRVGAQAVGAVHRHAGALAHGIQTVDDVVV